MHALISRLLPIALLAAGCHSETHDDGGHGSTDAHSSTAHEHGSTTGTTGHEHVTETTHDPATESGTTHAHASETTHAHESETTHAHESETTHEHATDTATSGGPLDPAQAYCECMVVYCHDDYHGTWGEDHEMSEAMCEAAANGLPSTGMPAMTGNSLDCRSYYCDLAKTDATACASAIGGGSCV